MHLAVLGWGDTNTSLVEPQTAVVTAYCCLAPVNRSTANSQKPHGFIWTSPLRMSAKAVASSGLLSHGFGLESLVGLPMKPLMHSSEDIWDSRTEVVIAYSQVEAEAELRGWQGFRGRARIRSHAETTDHSRKLASAIVCRWRRSDHVTRSSAWLIPHIF